MRFDSKAALETVKLVAEQRNFPRAQRLDVKNLAR
jgi:hypothetical protein